MAIPTADDFFARFPEFSEEDPARVDLILAEAEMSVDDTWIPAHRFYAMLYLAAHIIFSENIAAASYGGSVSSESGSVRTAGPVSRKTVGPLSVEYQKDSQTTGSSSGALSDPKNSLATSIYGARYLEYLAMSHPPVLAVAPFYGIGGMDGFVPIGTLPPWYC